MLRYRKSLKARIQVYLTLILTVSMLAGTVVGFLYFSRVSREQILSDERSKLHQLVNQLDYQVKDTIRFASSIAGDTEIQEILRSTNYSSEFDRTKKHFTLGDRLIFYNSMRQNIGLTTIIGDNGESFSSSNYLDAEYYITKFERPELKSFLSSADIFSSPYYTKDLNVPGNVICYKNTIRDFSKPDRTLGTMYLEFYITSFLSPIQAYGANYEDVIWSSAAGVVQYQKSEDPIRREKAAELSPAERVPSGYLISERVPTAGWGLSVYITDGHIQERSRFVLVFFALFFLITLGLMLLIIGRVISRVVEPIVSLTQTMSTVRQGNLSVCPRANTEDEIALLHQGFNDMLRDLDRYMKDQKRYEDQKKELEFAILLSQINPHYLYNVLNTIVYMASAEGNRQIVDIVNAQIRILQENLKIGEKSIYTTLRDELMVTDSYLIMQRLRYPDKFEITIQAEDRLLDAVIPKTMIQPLVENAIYHGIAPKNGTGTILLEITGQESTLTVSIRDDGIGMDEAVLEKFNQDGSLYEARQNRPRIGIANIRDRLRFAYGDLASMHIESKPGEFTQVVITLPLNLGLS